MKGLVTYLLIAAITVMAWASEGAASPSAGLYWGPIYAGNLKLYMTNAHTGYAGPKVGVAPHTNFHVDTKSGRGYVPAANFHITKYSVGSRTCTYIWESQSDRVVMDRCHNSWTETAAAAAQATKDFLKTILSNANWLAFLIVVGVVVVVLIALILSLPVVALASEPTEPVGPPVPPTDDGHEHIEVPVVPSMGH